MQHARVSWVRGREWFEHTLVDADAAINAMMWQSAGRCGADQWSFAKSPSVGEAVDPTGAYVRRWVPPPNSQRTFEAVCIRLAYRVDSEALRPNMSELPRAASWCSVGRCISRAA